eukprot:gene31123-6258_t
MRTDLLNTFVQFYLTSEARSCYMLALLPHPSKLFNYAAFVQFYLTSEARSCYMLTLLQRYSKLLNYTIDPSSRKRYMRYYKPVNEYMEEVMKPLENGRWWAINFAA